MGSVEWDDSSTFRKERKAQAKVYIRFKAQAETSAKGS
jgi:hypothetical protein